MPEPKQVNIVEAGRRVRAVLNAATSYEALADEHASNRLINAVKESDALYAFGLLLRDLSAARAAVEAVTKERDQIEVRLLDRQQEAEERHTLAMDALRWERDAAVARAGALHEALTEIANDGAQHYEQQKPSGEFARGVSHCGRELSGIAKARLAALASRPPQDERAAFDRDALGKIVRDAWCEWAREQSSPKPAWLVPWSELNETDREADRRIGEAVSRALKAPPPQPSPAPEAAGTGDGKE